MTRRVGGAAESVAVATAANTQALYRLAPGELLRAAPSSAADDDDEFATTGSGIPSGWSEWDVGNLFDSPGGVSVDERGLVLDGRTPNANRRLAGIYKDVPSGDFSVYVHCGVSQEEQVMVAAGLFIAQDIETNPNTGELNAVYVHRNVWPRVAAGQNIIFGSTSLSTNGDYPMANGSCWLRMRYDASEADIWADMSYDGIHWNRVEHFTAPDTPISKMGLFVAVDGNNRTVARFRGFRVRESFDAIDAVVPSATLEI